MNPRRVAITGMGVVSAIGSGVPKFSDALFACRSGIGERMELDESWSAAKDRSRVRHLAAEVTDLPPVPAFPNLPAASLDAFSKFALVAAGEAIADAGAEVIERNPHRTAVILSTAVGGDQSRDLASLRVLARDRAPHVLTIIRVMANAAVSAVSMAYGIRGPAFNVSSACASANHAIGQACLMLQSGRADVAVTGGAESLPSFSLYRSWQQLKVLSPDGCRPFAGDRNGTVLGEGAGIVVLELLDDARARGAKVYAEVAGFGMSSDAHDWVSPDADGMLRCMDGALRDAGLAAPDIAYVNAHGTGTLRGDGIEAEAMEKLFGGELARIPVSSTKALHGHALGASGAIELIATALALQERSIPAMPPAAHDPLLSLRLAHEPGISLDGEYAMSNSFGFGGLNASLVLRRVHH
jgi:nodulation protein E